MTETDIAALDTAPTTHARKLFLAGTAATIAYVVCLLIYSLSVWENMIKMKPDEFATFLSGVFAPLAFLWLVLGFRQQGDELQNSARALWLQGEELRNSVEQQRQLVAVSREQLDSELANRIQAEMEADRAAQPHLIMATPGGMFMGLERHFRLAISSGGPTCTNVKMHIAGQPTVKAAVFTEGNKVERELRYDRPDDVEPLDVLVEYVDQRGNSRQQAWHVPIDDTAGPNRDRAFGEPTKVGPVNPPQ